MEEAVANEPPHFRWSWRNPYISRGRRLLPQWVERGSGRERSDQIHPPVSNSFGVAPERLSGGCSVAANKSPLRIRVAGLSDIKLADVLGMVSLDVAGKTTRCGRRLS
jgi:hypothetical protein